MSIFAGTRFGSYEVTEVIGSGGMGEVYRARDVNLGRDVAIKVLSASFTSDANRVARFEKEARTLASLNHANIAHIFDLERSEGSICLVMELVEGHTLAERIARGPIPVEEALQIATQLTDALEAAHERGIVHRDLKPANVKVTPTGVAKVLDFGIAKALDPREATGSGVAPLTTPAMTEAGVILGTAAYMSPEQARGRPVDQRTDIWAFGCVLYEMLTGQAAFLGEDVTSTLARVLQASADMHALPSGTPLSVRRMLELCFEKDPRKRIADVRDARLGLEGAFAASGPAPSLPAWRRALPFGATLGAGLLLASIYFLGLRPIERPAGATPPAPVTRFVYTPPSDAPLANQGSVDLAISHDGRRIVYLGVKPDSGRAELYLRDFDSLETRPIPGTDAPNVGLWNPLFSPDGNTIVYAAPDRGLVTVALDGRPTIKIADLPDTFWGASWASDNTLIYSSSRRLLRVATTGGGAPVPISPEPTGSVGGPEVLPGGRTVLFHIIGDAAGRRVAALDLGTGDQRTLIEDASFPHYVTTGHLLFWRGETLMAVTFDASEVTVTGEPVALVQGIRMVSGGAPDFWISDNGTLAYVQRTPEETPQMAVVWLDRTGAQISRAIPDLVTNPRDPMLSPDGNRLLLVTGPDDDGDLWSYDLSGRPPIPLALPDDNRSPVWSPDGKQVAFNSLPKNETLALLTDGSERTPRILSSQIYLVPQAWSPAEELIVTRLMTNRGDIAAIPLAATGEVSDVVALNSSDWDPSLSPNGRWLAYASDRSGESEIWVQRYPEGAPVRLSSDGGYEPLWSADGRELYYRRGDTMMAAAVESGDEFSFAAPQPLFSGPYLQSPNSNVRGYDVAADGRFLMIQPVDQARTAAPASIVVVENFGEEIKARVRSSGTRSDPSSLDER